jgi:hypothetical protein
MNKKHVTLRFRQVQAHGGFFLEAGIRVFDGCETNVIIHVTPMIETGKLDLAPCTYISTMYGFALRTYLVQMDEGDVEMISASTIVVEA